MRPYLLFGAAVVGVLLFACGGTASRPHTQDAGGSSGGSTGSGVVTCDQDSDCDDGAFCIGRRCGSCRGARPIACPTDTVCQVSGACAPRGTSGSSGSGGTSGSGSSGSTGASACAARTDCPGADACVAAADGGDVCEAIGADGGCDSSDECPKQFICQAHACISGCHSNLDCHGTPLPKCITGNPGHCGVCTSANDCLSGEVCQGGQCTAANACTTAATCGGLGCVAGNCAACTGDGDCSDGNTCNTTSGHCVTPAAGCASDAQCQSSHGGSQAWYCDRTVATPACKLGCLADDQCPGNQGCCNVNAGYSCSQSTHACVPPSSTGGSTTGGSTGGSTTGGSTTGGSTGSACGTGFCDNCFSQGLQCDETNCQCTGTTPTTTGGTSGGSGGDGCSEGGSFQPCNSDCSCDNGLTCQYLIPGSGTPNAFVCAAFVCSGVVVCE